MKAAAKKFFQNLKKHRNPWIRISLGTLLVIGGILGFLPILGFWMVPLGLVLLAVDFRWARRFYLSLIVWWRRLRQYLRRWRA
ncbi:MAG: PGPGW domain-containing protein [Gammaproteobacteria bacterium]|nr:PGPGW domain-containing protein [Gammaproteobacteria bacterium]MDH3464964.1 PGPGW domain-containing protein [Gammaproteobacteria bacterium]